MIIQTIVDSNYSVSSLAVLPNGNFASGSFKQIKLYQKNNKTWILKRIFDETGIINSLAIFPNGDFANGSKSKITIYESKTQNVKQIISDFDHYVQILVTLPSGELAIGTNKIIAPRIFNIQSLFDCCLFDSCQIRLLSVFKIDIDIIFVLF
jgi:hypothetical protein